MGPFLHHYGQGLAGVGIGILLGGFFPVVATAAARFVAAKWHQYIVH